MSSNKIVTIASTDTAVSSDNGVSWILSSIPSGSTYKSIAYNGTYFVAIANSGGDVATSPDGITWTVYSGALPGSINWNNVIWNGTIFCAVGNTGSNNGFSAVSSDGITWNYYSVVGSSTSCNLFGLAWNGTVFCVTQILANIPTCLTSPNGQTWTQQSFGVNIQVYAIGWNGTVFCAIDGNGNTTVFTSPDGATWTKNYNAIDGSIGPIGIAWNGTVFCVVGYGTNLAATSPDGVTWTNHNMPSTSNWYNLCWNGTVFCADSQGTNKAATSPDGATWTPQTLPATTNWSGITSDFIPSPSPQSFINSGKGYMTGGIQDYTGNMTR